MKRCLLVGAAPSTGQGLTYILKTQSFDAVYAVDGGYAEVAARAITPDVSIGDFDSLGTTPCIQKFTNTIPIKISLTWILRFITPLRKVMRN